jgi:hypothetical protein
MCDVRCEMWRMKGRVSRYSNRQYVVAGSLEEDPALRFCGKNTTAGCKFRRCLIAMGFKLIAIGQ